MFEIVILLLIVGVVLYFFPIDSTIKNLILCIIVIAALLALLGHGFTGHGFFKWR